MTEQKARPSMTVGGGTCCTNTVPDDLTKKCTNKDTLEIQRGPVNTHENHPPKGGVERYICVMPGIVLEPILKCVPS